MTSKEAVEKIWEAHKDALQLLDLLREQLGKENGDLRLEALVRTIYKIISDSGEAVEVLEALVRRLEIYTSTEDDDDDLEWRRVTDVEEEIAAEEESEEGEDYGEEDSH